MENKDIIVRRLGELNKDVLDIVAKTVGIRDIENTEYTEKIRKIATIIDEEKNAEIKDEMYYNRTCRAIADLKDVLLKHGTKLFYSEQAFIRRLEILKENFKAEQSDLIKDYEKELKEYLNDPSHLPIDEI